MPWTLRTILIIALAGGLFELYVAHRAIRANSNVSSWPLKRIRLSVIAVIGWFVIYPVVLLASYYLELAPVSRALQVSGAFLDKILIYPFWIGMILSVQISQPILAPVRYNAPAEVTMITLRRSD
jgi:hypothetical protein